MKWKIEKKIAAVFLILLAIASAGCGKKEDKAEDVITGTDGLVISFIENFPQDKYILSSGETQDFTAVIDIKNKGAFSLEAELEKDANYATKKKDLKDKIAKLNEELMKLDMDKADAKVIATKMQEIEKAENELASLKEHIPKANSLMEKSKLFIGGFDTGIIKIVPTSDYLAGKSLAAVSSINPSGGFDTVEFGGKIAADKLGVSRYDPTILATACYPYATKAGPNVCIDPIPFDDKQKKVCNIGIHTLSSQGAPIAVTRIDQEASSTKLRFKITIKNAGNGDVIQPYSLEKCSSATNQLKREDFDLVELTSVKAGTNELLADCGPFAKQGTNLIRLFDGEGFVVCTMDISNIGSSAYLTPLIVELKYGYRTTASKQVSIRKIE